eukprot:gene14444-biopygen15668
MPHQLDVGRDNCLREQQKQCRQQCLFVGNKRRSLYTPHLNASSTAVNASQATVPTASADCLHLPRGRGLCNVK